MADEYFSNSSKLTKKKDIISKLRINQDNDNIGTGIRDKNLIYEFKEMLGEGAFCKVFKAIYKPTQELIAVKIHEIKGKLFLGMELVKDGRLTDIIREKQENNMKFTDNEASALMRGILRAVSYMHEQNIVHRDLKPGNSYTNLNYLDNILIQNKSDMSTCKVCDFGLSAKYQFSSGSMDVHCGTLIYMAPEVALNQVYTKCVDVWSIGIMMHVILTGGKHPLFNEEYDTCDSYKRKLKDLDSLEAPNDFSWLAKNLFQRLTKIQSHQRYTAKEALQHPWITRKNEANIPIRLVEHIHNFEYEQVLKKKMVLLFFMSMINQQNQSKRYERSNVESEEDMKFYKQKCLKVSKKIDSWHQQMSLKKQGTFKDDEDFITLGNSPSRFCSSDEEASVDTQVEQIQLNITNLTGVDSSKKSDNFQNRISNFTFTNNGRSISPTIVQATPEKMSTKKAKAQQFTYMKYQSQQRKEQKTGRKFKDQKSHEDDDSHLFTEVIESPKKQIQLMTQSLINPTSERSFIQKQHDKDLTSKGERGQDPSQSQKLNHSQLSNVNRSLNQRRKLSSFKTNFPTQDTYEDEIEDQKPYQNMQKTASPFRKQSRRKSELFTSKNYINQSLLDQVNQTFSNESQRIQDPQIISKVAVPQNLIQFQDIINGSLKGNSKMKGDFRQKRILSDIQENDMPLDSHQQSNSKLRTQIFNINEYSHSIKHQQQDSYNQSRNVDQNRRSGLVHSYQAPNQKSISTTSTNIVSAITSKFIFKKNFINKKQGNFVSPTQKRNKTENLLKQQKIIGKQENDYDLQAIFPQPQQSALQNKFEQIKLPLISNYGPRQLLPDTLNQSYVEYSFNQNSIDQKQPEKRSSGSQLIQQSMSHKQNKDSKLQDIIASQLLKDLKRENQNNSRTNNQLGQVLNISGLVASKQQSHTISTQGGSHTNRNGRSHIVENNNSEKNQILQQFNTNVRQSMALQSEIQEFHFVKQKLQNDMYGQTFDGQIIGEQKPLIADEKMKNQKKQNQSFYRQSTNITTQNMNKTYHHNQIVRDSSGVNNQNQTSTNWAQNNNENQSANQGRKNSKTESSYSIGPSNSVNIVKTTGINQNQISHIVSQIKRSAIGGLQQQQLQKQH
ncbi:protein kinase domain containing protein [Stylonychia lemnae]|uniref:Protein kinase domain containing protein n=1 Tax=Stylonychia lemnae TaxID=5949 RepID=A0A078BC29_STYLE|nr:protein kinase domain containing protein [Stylonychia lemnae]|eukprot:CDW90807.1 protein kinase domain containing protein [Stylonychia lemnae]